MQASAQAQQKNRQNTMGSIDEEELMTCGEET